MKMTKIILVAVFAGLGSNANAITPYFSAGGSLGIGGGDSSVRSGGFSGTVGVRYKLADINMRTEFEYNNLVFNKKYTYASNEYDYDLKTQLYLVNVLADIYGNVLKSGLHFGISVGAADYKRDLPEYWDIDDRDKLSFVYGATAGVGIYMLAGLYADVGVRYLRTLDDDAIDSFNPYFGLRYGF